MHAERYNNKLYYYIKKKRKHSLKIFTTGVVLSFPKSLKRRQNSFNLFNFPLYGRATCGGVI